MNTLPSFGEIPSLLHFLYTSFSTKILHWSLSNTASDAVNVIRRSNDPEAVKLLKREMEVAISEEDYNAAGLYV